MKPRGSKLPYNTFTPQKNIMSEFSRKRFVDIGQALYIEWLKDIGERTEEQRRATFKFYSELAFEAAVEFSEVFKYQEDN